MRSLLGEAAFAAYLAAMERAPKRALRVNTLKINADEFCALADFSLEPADISPECFLFGDDAAIGRHPLHAAGLCYVQEPSAQMPADLLDVQPGMAVLDLCAAPGGKTTQLAARMKNTGVLVANEPVRSRAETLCGNLERLGVRNTMVTCMHPDALAALLPAWFDRVLVDAPCSGEGMFRKDGRAVSEWSAAHVAACAARQYQILESAAEMLKPDGRLVYSTCTFSREENEDTVKAFLLRHSDFSCGQMRRLYPHTFPGEGQFMAAFEREPRAGTLPPLFGKPEAVRVPEWEAFYRETFSGEAPEVLPLPDGRVFLPPEGLPQKTRGLRILRAGVFAGEVRARRFVPGHALAMAFPADRFQRRIALDGDTLGRFLAGETVACGPALSGWSAVTAFGHPVGWGKAVNGVLKNKIPKGLRILR
jgi:NOL1/NOP2/sun family putative RNA methylase